MRNLTTEELVQRWNDRRRDGDQTRVASRTFYSTSHISNMIAGRRRMSRVVAEQLYRISSRRKTNAELASRHGMRVEEVMYNF